MIKIAAGRLIAFRLCSRQSCGGPDRYSPPQVVVVKSEVIRGNPDPAHASTSYAGGQNLTMRMHIRRFTRLTNAFSKKFDNHCHALALYFFWYNWVAQGASADAGDGRWPCIKLDGNGGRGRDDRCG